MVRKLIFAATAAAVAAATVPLIRSKSVNDGSPPKPRSWRQRITSHETFNHDSVDSLGYDWSRIANPAIAPKFPLKIYLPQTTEDVIRIVKDARRLSEHLLIRCNGHSSNDLVLGERASVIIMEKMNRVVSIDEAAMTATVQPGAISAEVDDVLAEMGLGLPIIGDHNHVTAGGFASVGGISPASHRFGMFVDNVERIEYVTWDGELRRASRTDHPEEMYRMLGGTGQHGVLVTLTLRLIAITKYKTLVENHQTHYRDVESFVKGSGEFIRDPGDALYERGVWIDFKLKKGNLRIGQFSLYKETAQSRKHMLRNRLAYGALHRIGYVAGRLPPGIDRILKYIGTIGVVFSPKFATIKNVEFFTDKILDSTVGDPTRMLIVLAPLNAYDELFMDSWNLMCRYREEYGCFTFVSVYVKSIKSPYLAQGREQDRFCELMFYLGIHPAKLTDEILDQLVSDFDDVVIRHRGFRYMHSRTVKDHRRELVDPNAYYAERAEKMLAQSQAGG